MQLNEAILPENIIKALEPKQQAILYTALGMFLQKNRDELAVRSLKTEESSVLAGKLKQMYHWLTEETDMLIETLFSGCDEEGLKIEVYLQEGLDKAKKRGGTPLK